MQKEKKVPEIDISQTSEESRDIADLATTGSTRAPYEKKDGKK